MEWPDLVAKPRTKPATGNWHNWKQEIADYCCAKCVYCAITESRFGGIRNFHVEHFRPRARFPALEDEISNLYLACAICNILKNDDWPAEPLVDDSAASYPDPAITNYNHLFSISKNHEVESIKVAGKYVVERLLLNRAQLIYERRLDAIHDAYESFDNWVRSIVDEVTLSELRELVTLLARISKAKSKIIRVRPYRDHETKRVIKPKVKSKRSRR